MGRLSLHGSGLGAVPPPLTPEILRLISSDSWQNRSVIRRFDRDISAAIVARFISRTGGEAAFFVGIWGKAAYEFQADASSLAGLMAALGVASLAGSAVAGALIDRYGPRKVLLASEVLFAPATVAAAFSTSMPELSVAAAAIGLFGAPAYTAIASLGPFITDDPDRLARINAGLETGGMAALISGTAVGAALAASVSIDAIFWFDGATSLVAAVIVWPIRTRPPLERRVGDGGSFSEVRRGFTEVYGNRRLRFYVLAATSVWLLFGLFGALEPLFYRDVLGTGPEAIGLVNMLLGIGLVAGTLGVARLSARRRSAVTTVGLLGASGAIGVAYVGTDRLWVVIVAGTMWGVVLGAFLPLVRTLIQLNTTEEVMGRVMGTTQVHGEAAKLLPLLAAPAMAGAFGVQLTLAGASAVLVAGSLAAVGVARELDRTRAVPVPAPSSDEDWMLDAPRTPAP